MAVTHSDPVTPGTNATGRQYNWLRNDMQFGWVKPQRNTSGDENAPIFAVETLTYASASTITVATDATERYEIGDKLRLKQGAGYKYFYIVGVTATLLTVTGGSDYTVANAAITDVYVSKAASPVDFPTWMNYTPVWTGFSADPTVTTAKFAIYGRLCFVKIHLGAMGASNATTLTVTFPVVAVNAQHGIPAGTSHNNSTTQTTLGVVNVGNGSNVATCYPAPDQGAWTASNNKGIFINCFYEI